MQHSVTACFSPHVLVLVTANHELPYCKEGIIVGSEQHHVVEHRLQLQAKASQAFLLQMLFPKRQ